MFNSNHPKSTNICKIQGQKFSDPYGLIYKCNSMLQPILINDHESYNFDPKTHWFDSSDYTIKKYDTNTDNFLIFKGNGLPPISFQKDFIEYPFIISDNKIKLYSECDGVADNTAIAIGIDKISEILPDKGSPYAICLNNKIEKIEWCDKYYIFETKCVFSNPCLIKQDGFVINTLKDRYSYCKDGKIEEKICGEKELLKNLECVKYPCLNEKDGTILSFDENSFMFCENETIKQKICQHDSIGTKYGCSDKRCKNTDGLNSVSGAVLKYESFGLKCLHGAVVDTINCEKQDDTYLNLLLLSGYDQNFKPIINHKQLFDGEKCIDLMDTLYSSEFTVPYKFENEYFPNNMFVKFTVVGNKITTDYKFFFLQDKKYVITKDFPDVEDYTEFSIPSCPKGYDYDIKTQACENHDINPCYQYPFNIKRVYYGDFLDSIGHCISQNFIQIKGIGGGSFDDNPKKDAQAYIKHEMFGIPLPSSIGFFKLNDENNLEYKIENCRPGLHLNSHIPICVKENCKNAYSQFIMIDKRVYDCANEYFVNVPLLKHVFEYDFDLNIKEICFDHLCVNKTSAYNVLLKTPEDTVSVQVFKDKDEWFFAKDLTVKDWLSKTFFYYPLLFSQLKSHV